MKQQNKGQVLVELLLAVFILITFLFALIRLGNMGERALRIAWNKPLSEQPTFKKQTPFPQGKLEEAFVLTDPWEEHLGEKDSLLFGGILGESMGEALEHLRLQGWEARFEEGRNEALLWIERTNEIAFCLKEGERLLCLKNLAP